MKLLHFADTHIGVTSHGGIDSATGLNTQVVDYLKCFDEVVDCAVSEEVDLVLFAGDMYKTRNPSQTNQKEVVKRIIKLSEVAPIVMVEGNHDQQRSFGKASSLDIFAIIDNVYVSVQPEVLVIDTKSGPIRVVCLPYPAKYDINDALQTLSFSGPTICVAHVSIVNAKLGTETTMGLGAEDSVFADRFEGFDYVALGHIHRHQEVGKNMVYSGSMARSSFAEPEEKGFVIVEDGKWEFVPVRARAYLDVVASTLEDAKAELDRDLSELIVRVTLEVENAEDMDVNDVKPLLKGAYRIASIAKNIARRDRRPESIGIEGMSTTEMLERYFDSKGIGEARRKKLFEAFGKMRECSS